METEELFLMINSINNGNEFIEFLTFVETINAISCTDPQRFFKTIDEINKFEKPLDSYSNKRKITDFKKVSSELINKCVEEVYIGGTLCRYMKVIKNTPENRKFLGI